MNLLIAIKSCQRDANRGDHQVIRDTWGRNLLQDMTLRFFYGGGGIEANHIQDDEVVLNCDDDYGHLPDKTKEILEWSLNRGFDYTWLADTDTFARPQLFSKVGYEHFDYVGVNSRTWGVTFPYHAPDRDKKDWFYPHCYPWCSGGYGAFLSRRAAELIVAEPTDAYWAEDLMIGQVLGRHPEIRKHSIAVCWISYHFPQSEYNSQYDPQLGWMEKMQQLHGDKS